MTRREFSAALAAQATPSRKPKVAAIVTEYRWFSHADVICGRLLGGCSPNNVWRAPRTELVSVYTAQVPANDMSRDLSARHGFKIYPTIREALTLGGEKLAVDGVVFIGEHGNYPSNELGQKLYPRFELFSEILDVYEANGRGVPTFFDKHLSYSWDKALSMYQRAAKLKLPWFAGSSIPLTVRQPVIDIPLDAPIAEAAVVGYADLDAYGFHTLEAVQSLMERRRGGETGVAKVEMVEGERARQLASGELVTTALHAQKSSLENNLLAVFVVDYRDGLKLIAPMLKKGHWSAALRTPQGVLATKFGIDGGRPLPHFDGLVSQIEEMIVTRKAPYPVERTLLTTGILSFLFESRRRKGPVETPQLDVKYRAPESAWWQRA